MNADQILAIRVEEPERLFRQDDLKDQRISLLKEWHPDRNHDPKASSVFDHVQKLYDEAVAHVEKGIWNTPGLLSIKGSDGRVYEVRYLREHAFDLGSMYVGRGAVIFLVDKAHHDLYSEALDRMRRITYPDKKVEDAMKPLMPDIQATFSTADGRDGLVLRKTQDVLLLKDVQTHLGGKIDPKHVAWIMSRLLNIASFAQVTGQVLPDISSETVFISPPFHSGLVLGGWWFHHRVGEKLRALPAKALAFMPKHLLKDKQANVRMTGESVKALGRELLGDRGGSSLRMNKEIPKAMVEWLAYPASDNAIADYGVWRDSVLKDSFGDRRFVKLSIEASDIYK